MRIKISKFKARENQVIKGTLINYWDLHFKKINRY